jgi:hypothetical protein
MALPLHEPLGFRIDGSPYWAAFGSEGEGDGGGGDGGGDGGTGTDADADGDGDGDDDPLAKATKALEKERTTVGKQRGELRGFKAIMRESGVNSLEELRAKLQGPPAGTGQQTGQQQAQVDIEKIRREATAQANAIAYQQIALSKIEARAAGRFADPSDVVAHFRGSAADFVGDDGAPDVAHIDRELASLLVQKPHWGAKKDDTPPDFEGGARITSTVKGGMDEFVRGVAARRRGQ